MAHLIVNFLQNTGAAGLASGAMAGSQIGGGHGTSSGVTGTSTSPGIQGSGSSGASAGIGSGSGAGGNTIGGAGSGVPTCTATDAAPLSGRGLSDVATVPASLGASSGGGMGASFAHDGIGTSADSEFLNAMAHVPMVSASLGAGVGTSEMSCS